MLIQRLRNVGDEQPIAHLVDAHLGKVLLGEREDDVALYAVLDEDVDVFSQVDRLEHLAQVLDRPRGGLVREAQFLQRRHGMRRELDAERRRPVDDIVVELREQLDEVQPIAHQVEAELLQMILGE